MTRVRGQNVVRKALRHRGRDRASTARGTYRLRGSNPAPPVGLGIPTTVVEVPHVAVGVTIHAPIVFAPPTFQQLVVPHVAVPVTVFSPATRAVVKTDHLAVPVTIHAPTLTYAVVLPHLAVPVTLYAPGIQVAGMTIATPHVAVPVTIHPPSIRTIGLWFLPPIEPFEKVPSLERTEWLMQERLGTGVPRSIKYRQFLRTQVGKDVTIAGVFYGGGRWHGPLTGAQVSEITAAGYGARIIARGEHELLPAGLD
jgi:hypothetical protein